MSLQLRTAASSNTASMPFAGRVFQRNRLFSDIRTQTANGGVAASSLQHNRRQAGRHAPKTSLSTPAERYVGTEKACSRQEIGKPAAGVYLPADKNVMEGASC